MSKPTLVILAAGMGSRFGGLKQLAPVGPNDQIIIDYSVYDALKAGFGKVVFIIKKQMEQVMREQLLSRYEGHIETELVFQELEYLPEGFIVPDGREKPWGTGHALLMAEPAVSTPFCVINADDFYGYAAYRDMARFLTTKASAEHYSMSGYRLEKTLSLHGTVSRGVCDINENGHLRSITERTKIGRQDGMIVAYEAENEIILPPETLVSMNFWGFSRSVFDYLKNDFVTFLRQRGSEMKSEFLLPEVIDALIKQERVNVSVLDSQSEWFGITYKEDLEATRTLITQKTENGEYPAKLWD
jgi:NDP-sugar pyrophosphorylase family protein